MNKRQLPVKIWASANEMRSKIGANEYKDYILGFIYEHLISNFAANAGKKAGEFYIPHEVSVLMSEIVAGHLKDKRETRYTIPPAGRGRCSSA